MNFVDNGRVISGRNQNIDNVLSLQDARFAEVERCAEQLKRTVSADSFTKRPLKVHQIDKCGVLSLQHSVPGSRQRLIFSVGKPIITRRHTDTRLNMLAALLR
ncbi:MAG: hypothetical protein AAFS01_00310 [Pseudomonadota bacterium]